MNIIERYAPLAARLLVAHIFMLGALMNVWAFDGTVAFMNSLGIPAAHLLLSLSLPFEFIAGLMIAVGWKARWASLALLAWLIIVTPIFHRFWNISPAEVQNQMYHFMKNLYLMGALLFIVAFGSGPISLAHELKSYPA
ncbi:DoxX family protein [Paraburkholderia sp. RL18-085-BIA-A]|uniref:DoxX family protein n=1 Tax=Paraburkholderia sp. RL18-085-BIA-A TaxID=3031633 RepID=UPI0038BA9A73